MARKHEHEEHVNHEAWAIPYGDLVTLLLAFFVVMYAVSSVNEGKYRVLSDSLNAAFRGTPRTMEPVAILILIAATALVMVAITVIDAAASHAQHHGPTRWPPHFALAAATIALAGTSRSSTSRKLRQKR